MGAGKYAGCSSQQWPLSVCITVPECACRAAGSVRSTDWSKCYAQRVRQIVRSLPRQSDPTGPNVVNWPRCRARDASICGVLRGVMTSCNALVYEAIQRVYRNAVVDRIRSGMQAAYPDDYEKRVTSPFPSWDDIVSAAAQSAVTGVVAHPHQDVFDYLDVSHFPVLLNNYFSVLVPVEGLPPEQAKDLKMQVVSYAREIKTIRDPLSHPGTPDIGVFDALRAVDNAIRALRVLGLPEAAEKIGPLFTEVAAMVSAAPVMVSKPVRL